METSASRLTEFLSSRFAGRKLIVVSNRQPVSHVWERGGIRAKHSPGGVVSALEPVLAACGGTWVAAGTGNADREVCNPQGRIMLPEDNPAYTLRRVWLTKQEIDGYYHGFANEALWPLCHRVFQRPAFRREDWEVYRTVNERFAEVVAEEMGDQPSIVWFQDYHLCLAARYLKQLKGDNAYCGMFWHIPWPSSEVFRVCPWKHDLLDGMLANDYLGFHIQFHCNNFLDVVDTELECRVDRERHSVVRSGHETLVRAHPISIDTENIQKRAGDPECLQAGKALRDEFGLGSRRVLLGLDRIDYTKGIPERLLAYRELLEEHPEYHQNIVMVQMGAPSRTHIPRYQDLNDEIDKIVDDINYRFGSGSWEPVIVIRRQLGTSEVVSFFGLADVMVVTSLHDGMNLVAKEFVTAARPDTMLVLSRFTGAARELREALLVNPYNREETAAALHEALSMAKAEKDQRMEKMRATIREHDIFRWALTNLREFNREANP